MEKTYPASNFIIIVSFTETLNKIFEQLRNSIWWNHEAPCMIVNTNSAGSCQKARSLLSTAWDFNILFVVYVCRDVYNQVLFYTFNPYTRIAPGFWNVIQANYTSDDPWTLLEHRIEESSALLSVSGKNTSKK